MSDLEFLFHPKSIAVVGARRDSGDMAGGPSFVGSLVKCGYKGDIYPVNPKASEIMGFKSYPDLKSLPQPADYVICRIPASLAPQLIRDCASTGVKAVALYTAGFSEAGQEGAVLERELVSIAREGGVRLVGPNCMGIYCPGAGLSYHPGFSAEAGPVGVLCQSGGNSNVLVFVGHDRGICFSKVISYGNAADLNETDFLEYLAEDYETRVIAAYIEGTKGGPGFFKALSKAARAKPVIVLKGGRTRAGTRAASSHTGSLAAAGAIWDALCQQAGAIQVYSLSEMLDSIETALYMKPPKGRRVGVVGWGGGGSVTGADACESAGLRVPRFSSELREELAGFAFGPGISVSNPVDSPVLTNPSLLSKIMRLLASSNEVDVLIVQLPLEISHIAGDSGMWGAARQTVLETGASLDFPTAVVQPQTTHPDSSAVFCALQRRCIEVGLPVYPSIGQAAGAINRDVQYHLWKGAQ